MAPEFAAYYRRAAEYHRKGRWSDPESRRGKRSSIHYDNSRVPTNETKGTDLIAVLG